MSTSAAAPLTRMSGQHRFAVAVLAFLQFTVVASVYAFNAAVSGFVRSILDAAAG